MADSTSRTKAAPPWSVHKYPTSAQMITLKRDIELIQDTAPQHAAPRSPPEHSKVVALEPPCPIADIIIFLLLTSLSLLLSSSLEMVTPWSREYLLHIPQRPRRRKPHAAGPIEQGRRVSERGTYTLDLNVEEAARDGADRADDVCNRAVRVALIAASVADSQIVFE